MIAAMRSSSGSGSGSSSSSCPVHPPRSWRPHTHPSTPELCPLPPPRSAAAAHDSATAHFRRRWRHAHSVLCCCNVARNSKGQCDNAWKQLRHVTGRAGSNQWLHSHDMPAGEGVGYTRPPVLIDGHTSAQIINSVSKGWTATLWCHVKLSEQLRAVVFGHVGTAADGGARAGCVGCRWGS